MKTIKPNQDFKHGRKSYKKNRKYKVDEEDAEYFAACGWIGEQIETGKVQSLDIHDMTLGHSSEVN